MDNNNTAPGETTPAPDTSGSTLPPTQDYTIAPEDQALADQISNFDPIRDVPSRATRKGGTQKPLAADFSAKALSPVDREVIEGQLRSVAPSQRAQREGELVHALLTSKALEYRIKAGPGEGANEFVKERFKIAKERHEADREIFRLHSELAKVDRWVPVFNEVTGEPVIDPATGQQQVRAIETIQGGQRAGMEARIAELEHKQALLDGPEGDLRERKALWQAVQSEKALREALEIEKAADAKSDEIVRQERIDARAEARAKSKRLAL